MAFASNGATRIYWRLDGEADKPALLLLSSIGTDMHLWDALVPALTPQVRVLRMDTRGHGASDAPGGDYDLETLAADALAVMDAAGVERAAVCGLSLGCRSAARCSAMPGSTGRWPDARRSTAISRP
jgi:3-oxoadipate enol-lactonase/4-carboxymuconolactone decarboxylase